jgi:predicted adenylyl cyclase CyaB
MINLEIKVAASNEEMLKKIETIDTKPLGLLHQVDTYFSVGKRRLKLREEEGGSYLVSYTRPDTLSSKFSKYHMVHIPTYLSAVTKRALAFIFGVKVVVKKTRNLFICRHTRIHLDEVENLGSYVELETVIGKGLDGGELRNEHRFIIQALGLNTSASVGESYSDLLLSSRTRPPLAHR